VKRKTHGSLLSRQPEAGASKSPISFSQSLRTLLIFPPGALGRLTHRHGKTRAGLVTTRVELAEDFLRHAVHRRDEPVRVATSETGPSFRIEFVAEHAKVAPREVRHRVPRRVPQTDEDEDSGDHESYAIE
jgi:hypothetical protein